MLNRRFATYTTLGFYIYMLLRGLKILPQTSSAHAGRVLLSSAVMYEVYGPFGQGYNIRTSCDGDTATLSYHWRDGPGAEVLASSGRYEMSDESAYDSQGKKCIELEGDRVTTDIRDELVLALFVVNHYFATKTGPFTRNSSPK
ncbi:hypothetical protein [Massilia sp. TWP1-3-3]|uniref:hypothetical protein n=1 Tax=Massilia sp. TWP1-3-3 TaxID=2804573 RepID=UPI003CEC433A